jgi:hypothetical protein
MIPLAIRNQVSHAYKTAIERENIWSYNIASTPQI